MEINGWQFEILKSLEIWWAMKNFHTLFSIRFKNKNKYSLLLSIIFNSPSDRALDMFRTYFVTWFELNKEQQCYSPQFTLQTWTIFNQVNYDKSYPAAIDHLEQEY